MNYYQKHTLDTSTHRHFVKNSFSFEAKSASTHLWKRSLLKIIATKTPYKTK